jgi:hypothetical protein
VRTKPSGQRQSNPINGEYELRFELYDAAGGGALLGTITIDSILATDGLFTVPPNFGKDAFDETGRCLRHDHR